MCLKSASDRQSIPIILYASKQHSAYPEGGLRSQKSKWQIALSLSASSQSSHLNCFCPPPRPSTLDDFPFPFLSFRPSFYFSHSNQFLGNRNRHSFCCVICAFAFQCLKAAAPALKLFLVHRQKLLSYANWDANEKWKGTRIGGKIVEWNDDRRTLKGKKTYRVSYRGKKFGRQMGFFPCQKIT